MSVRVCEPKFKKAKELNKDLTWSSEVPRLRPANARDLYGEVPGQPLLSVSKEEQVLEFLERDLSHESLNRLFPLFWLVATQRHDHVSALHDQIVKGREIVVTEDPGLHLLWYYDRVFIKPLPTYLTSHAFWMEFLCRESSTNLRKAALGYVRSYYHLIKCQSDINVAKAKQLIGEDVDANALLHFLHSFKSLSHNDVTLRYRYGELRLSRINFYIKFYEFRLYYRKVHWQYSDYLTSFIAPLAFVFALVSTALSAMQVVLAAQQISGNQAHAWHTFISVSQWSAIIFLIFIVICALFLPLILFSLLFRELHFALRHGHPDA